MKNWTVEEDYILYGAYEANIPVSQIAEKLGRTPGAVRGRASYLGISKIDSQKIEETEGEHEEIMECPYCGQILLIEDECNCAEAKRERKKLRRIEQAKESIEELFGESSIEEWGKAALIENIELMNAAAVQIANYKMHGVSFSFPQNIHAKISINTKGAIKVERSETKKTTNEIAE